MLLENGTHVHSTFQRWGPCNYYSNMKPLGLRRNPIWDGEDQQSWGMFRDIQLEPIDKAGTMTF